MIGHQHEGVEDPPRTMNGFVQPVDESLPVRIVANDVLPGVAPGHDVVNRISILDSKAATHGSIGPKQQCPCKKKLINQSDPTGRAWGEPQRPRALLAAGRTIPTHVGRTLSVAGGG